MSRLQCCINGLSQSEGFGRYICSGKRGQIMRAALQGRRHLLDSIWLRRRQWGVAVAAAAHRLQGHAQQGSKGRDMPIIGFAPVSSPTSSPGLLVQMLVFGSCGGDPSQPIPALPPPPR